MIGNDSSRTPPPLPPAVEALLAHERELAPTAEMVRARALARAREALLDTDGVAVARRAAPPRYRQLLYAAAASVVLFAGAAAAYQMFRPAPSSSPPSTAGAPGPARPAATPVAVPEPTVAPAVVPEPVEVAAEPASAKAPGSPRRVVLAARHQAGPEELRLLDRARRADARGDYLGVLGVAAEHERRYPTGRLAEEREALRVKALVGLGRSGEARQVAANFRRQFPRSVLLHKIEDMLASLR